MALDEDIPEHPEDKTVPRYRQSDKRAGDMVIEWGKELEIQFQAWVNEHGHRSTTATKRAAPSDAGSSNSKKLKTEGISDEDMRERFGNNTIDKLTLPVLKDWASGKKLATNGKKGDIVERIQTYYESK
jgi:ATP-dependent DNA helicase 2 subunit 1